MKIRFWPLADLRAFRWRLEPLHRKLRADLDAAQFTLATLLRQDKEMGEAIRLLDQQFLKDARDVLNAPLQPQNRACSLQFLADRGGELDARRREAAELRRRITAARERCMAAERRLVSLETLRGNAQAAFAQEQMRAAAREADTAWLANHYLPGSAVSQRGKAP